MIDHTINRIINHTKKDLSETISTINQRFKKDESRNAIAHATACAIAIGIVSYLHTCGGVADGQISVSDMLHKHGDVMDTMFTRINDWVKTEHQVDIDSDHEIGRVIGALLAQIRRIQYNVATHVTPVPHENGVITPEKLVYNANGQHVAASYSVYRQAMLVTAVLLVIARQRYGRHVAGASDNNDALELVNAIVARDLTVLALHDIFAELTTELTAGAINRRGWYVSEN